MMNPDDHIHAVPVPGTDLYEVYTSPLMGRVLDRAANDPRMAQLHMAFEATDDDSEQELLLSEMARRMEQLGRLESLT